MTVNVPIFYQSSGVTPSNVYYSNARHPVCINTALLPLRAIKCNTKGLYRSVKYDR